MNLGTKQTNTKENEITHTSLNYCAKLKYLEKTFKHAKLAQYQKIGGLFMPLPSARK